ncbi:MAG: hypothetical protein UX31_C0006G0051 [Candidatus Nomurabacteria bacterium GW2011_GWA1_46_11]|uniref:Plastocyanin n=1 Tax=Candidatus Nomurabacteria bacterium GW2011_GWA1_46_11 TaxID=1618732 RepID=A0A0G1NNF7_9BACT|nr:MAG: hypothetical protein UX31_C0006G0051 [Candidatus Nomurabacteria bacterium GW2011_GWA1_46_11]
MNKTFLVVALIVVAALGIWYFTSQSQAPAVNETENVGGNGTVEEATDGGNVITFTGTGFSPGILTVKAGETVKFVNSSDGNFWPASAMHPTHTVYPGSGIEKCDTAERESIFDACDGIAPGGSYEFIFNEVGEWGYHNHLDAKFFGKVVVE